MRVRYFITGGAGFIGSNYVDYLLDGTKNVSSVTVYDKFTYAGKEENLQKHLENPIVKVIRGDICDPNFLTQSMAEHDYVVHFAAESHVDRSIKDGKSFVNTNVLGSFNVFQAALENGVKSVLHVSTDEVYGSLSVSSANETDLLKPNSPYAASKASSDLIARSFHVTHGLDVKITRCCNNYGNNQHPEKLVPLLIRNSLNGIDLPIYGDGQNIREWIHVSDHCRAIHMVLLQGTAGEIYNVGTAEHFSNIEIANWIIRLSETKKSKIRFVEDRKGHDYRYSINSNKIKNLGFKALKEFELGINETYKHYKEYYSNG